MLQLAIPVILTYLGLMTMGLVDLICVGRLSPAAIGAVGVGTSIFAWFMIFGIGLLTSLDYLISFSFGAGEHEDCHAHWVQGMWISAALGVPLTLLLIGLSFHLGLFVTNSEVADLTRNYLIVVALSLIPVYAFTATRQYLQAIGHPHAAMWILLIANLLNALVNWVLIFGHWGFPRFGVLGSAVATLLARIFMMAAVVACLLYYDRQSHRHFSKIGLPVSIEKVREILRLGLPSAFQMLLEVGVFALSTLIAARLSPVAIAAHQIVLNIASITFMGPLGISSATSVLVGQELGKGQSAAAVKTGWKGIRLGVSFMLGSAILLLTFGRSIISVYTTDPSVTDLSLKILFIAALFQLSDGTQITATGALRGIADTRAAMITNLFGHWAIGLPIGILFCFYLHMGLSGLWIGLASGLTSVAILLSWRWHHRSRAIAS